MCIPEEKLDGGGGVVKESPKIGIHGGTLNSFAKSKGEGEIFVFPSEN